MERRVLKILYKPMTRFHDNPSPRMEEQICGKSRKCAGGRSDLCKWNILKRSPDPTWKVPWILRHDRQVSWLIRDHNAAELGKVQTATLSLSAMQQRLRTFRPYWILSLPPMYLPKITQYAKLCTNRALTRVIELPDLVIIIKWGHITRLKSMGCRCRIIF